MPVEVDARRGLATLDLRNLGGGLFEGTAPDKPAENQFRVLDNLIYDEDYPSLKTRKGLRPIGRVYDSLGNPVNQPIELLSRFQKRDGTTYLLAAAGGVLGVYNRYAGRFVHVYTGLTAGYPVRATTFNNLHILVNGKDAPLKFDGATVAPLGGSPPVAKFIAHHHQRVYLWGNPSDPSRLYISALGNPEDWSKPNDAHNFLVEPDDDAGGPTGLAVSPRIPRLLLFKERAMYELFGTDIETWEVQLVTANVGCIAPDSIVQARDVVLFLDQYGQVRAYRGGGAEPEVISHPAVERTLATLSRGYAFLARAILTPDDKYVLFFPTSGTYPTRAVVYDLRRGTWHTWTLPYGVSYLSVLDPEGRPVLCVGTQGGTVYALDGTTDDGAVIAWAAETPAFDFGPHRVAMQRVLVEGNGTVQVSFALSERGSFGPAVTLSPADSWASARPAPSQRGHAVRLRLTGSGPVRIDQVYAELLITRGV